MSHKLRTSLACLLPLRFAIAVGPAPASISILLPSAAVMALRYWKSSLTFRAANIAGSGIGGRGCLFVFGSDVGAAAVGVAAEGSWALFSVGASGIGVCMAGWAVEGG